MEEIRNYPQVYTTQENTIEIKLAQKKRYFYKIYHETYIHVYVYKLKIMKFIIQN